MDTESQLRRAVVAVVATAWLASGHAAPTERTPVQTLKPLLMQAAASGSAQGVLVGPVADGIGRSSGSYEPIEVDVTQLGDLAEAGCARLRVVTRQDAVRPSAASAPTIERNQTLSFNINYCVNGRFPRAASSASQ